MKYLFINSVYGVGSTGKIIYKKCHELIEQGNICVVAYGRETIIDDAVNLIKIGNKKDYLIHAGISRLLDCQGFLSGNATKKFLKKIEESMPDIIWLHNIHGYYINIKLLFEWLKKHPDVKVLWTMHDCWSFTGHCSHFTLAKCDRWKDGCFSCPQKKEYPKSFFVDRSKQNYMLKKSIFTGVSNLNVLTPSKWLADLVKKSFLNEYNVEVHHNTIDYTIFKPTKSNFRKDYKLESKKMVLGVATSFEETKGFYDMLMLREKLDNSYEIVLVGLTEKQILQLPEGITGLKRTKNQTELAGIYTTADVFVNPTHQDNFPTVNLEARACGTTAITYNVGGSPEGVANDCVVQEGDIDALVKKIKSVCE